MQWIQSKINGNIYIVRCKLHQNILCWMFFRRFDFLQQRYIHCLLGCMQKVSVSFIDTVNVAFELQKKEDLVVSIKCATIGVLIPSTFSIVIEWRTPFYIGLYVDLEIVMKPWTQIFFLQYPKIIFHHQLLRSNKHILCGNAKKFFIFIFESCIVIDPRHWKCTRYDSTD